MAKRSLSEEEILCEIFNSSDEDDPAEYVCEADIVYESMHDAQSWQEEEAEVVQRAAYHAEDFEETITDLSTSYVIPLVPGRPTLLPVPSAVVPGPPLVSAVPSAATASSTAAVPVLPSGSPHRTSKRRAQGSTVPSAGVPGPALLSAVPSSATTAPPSASSVPPSACSVPPSASSVPPSASSTATPSASPLPPAVSSVELKSRKRSRGPLNPAEGIALKQLSDAVYRAKDNTKWHSVPNPSLPPILPVDAFDTAGPTMAVFGAVTPAEAFFKFLPEVLLAEIVVHTNDKIVALRSKYKRQSDPTFKDLSLMELCAFLSIIIMAGARKDNHLTTEEMFSRSQGCPFYRSVMSEGRFCFILRALRFDSMATRADRVKEDKFAPIRSLWDQVIAKSIENYEPGGHLTVDEQLLAFRGRCSFRMYIPNKPAK